MGGKDCRSIRRIIPEAEHFRMDIKQQIKTLLAEAKVYQKQGLLDDAKDRYRKAAEIIKQNPKIKNRENLLDIISNKLYAVDQSTEIIKKTPETKEISENIQELIKELFTFSKGNDKEAALLEGAITLAKFGQHKKALQEFRQLLKIESLRIVVAKNILRCHIEISSLEKAVEQYKKWLSSDFFTVNQLNKIRFFLKGLIKKQNAAISLPKVEEEVEIDLLEKEIVDLNEIGEAEAPAEKPPRIKIPIREDDDFLDISSIGIHFESGPQKGKIREFEVSFQTGNKLNLVISGKEQQLLDILKEGMFFKDIQLYSPIAMLNGSGVVLSKKRIESGPRRGNFSIDIVIESA